MSITTHEGAGLAAVSLAATMMGNDAFAELKCPRAQRLRN